MKPVLNKSDLIEQEKQRYSIRKLTVGATSVLLGTTLFFVPAPEIVKADDHDNKGNSQAAITEIAKEDEEPTSSEIRPATDSITVQEVKNNQGDTEKIVVTPPKKATTDTTLTDNKAVADGTTGDDNHAVPNGNVDNDENATKDITVNGNDVATDTYTPHGVQKPASTDASKQENTVIKGKNDSTSADKDSTNNSDTKNNGFQNSESPTNKPKKLMQNQIKQALQIAPPEEHKYTQIISDTTQIDAQNGHMSLNLLTNEFEKGDTIQVIFHQKGKDLDATGTYNVEAGKNESLATTTISGNQDKDLIVYNTFNDGGTFNQFLILDTNTNFRKDILQKDGNFEQSIDVVRITKNGSHLLKTFTFKERVDHRTTFYPNEIITTDPQPQYVPSEIAKRKILPNQNYDWGFDFFFYPNFNQGTDIIIPTPENFIYDANESEKASPDLLAVKATTSYSDNKIKIRLPALTNKELSTLKSGTGGGYRIFFDIIGKIQKHPSANDQQFIASDYPISITDTGTSEKRVASTNNKIAVTVVGTDNAPDKLSADKFLSVEVDPDKQEYINGKWKNVTSIATKYDHGMNRIWLKNESAYGLDDISVDIDVPDGMDIRDIFSDNTFPDQGVGQFSHITYNFTLKDGTTTQTYNSIPREIEDDTDLQSQPIKTVHVHADHLYAYQNMFYFYLGGKLAPKYNNGNKVQVGDHLVTAANVKINGKTYKYSVDQEVIDDHKAGSGDHHEDHAENWIIVNTDQENQDVGTYNSGSVTFNINELIDNPTNIDLYYVLPTNATLNWDRTIKNLKLNADVSQFDTNNRKVVKIHFNNCTVTPYTSVQIFLNNSQYVTKKDLYSDGMFYATFPKNESADLYYGHKVWGKESEYVENNSNGYYINKGTWFVLPATGIYTVAEAQGNENHELTRYGSSDDKKADKKAGDMTFTNTVVNGSNEINPHTVTLSNVPNHNDGKSEFDFYLTSPITTIDAYTGHTITEGVHYYYFEHAFDLNKINVHNDDWKKGALTSDEVKDWSSIKAVAAVYDKMNINSAYQLQLHGYDPSLANDCGKTAYMNNTTWSDILNPTLYKSGEKKSASITVRGTSTIHVRFHYTDETGEHYLNAGDVPFLDNDDQDQLTSQSVLRKVLDPYNNNQFNSIKEILKDFSINTQNPVITNSDHGDYFNGAKNETAQWGTPKYYIDGDIITYEIKKHVNFSKNIIIKRDIDFISTVDGHKLKNTFTESTSSILGYYNPYTNEVTLPESLSLYDIYNVLNNNKIEGYLDILSNNTYNNTIYGLRYSNVEEYLEHNIDILNGNKNGLVINVDYNNSKGYQYTIDKNKKIDSNTIEFYLHQNIYYIPSYANLIALGITNNEPNKVLEIAKSYDQNGTDQIQFKTTDTDLKRAGYTYKIYVYDNSQLSNMFPVPSTDIPFYDFISKGNLEGYSSYDSLADALQQEGTYDNNFDTVFKDGIPNKNDGSIAYLGNNTQTFFVVYTPLVTNKSQQEAYILSDDDPYNNDEITKPFAMSGSIDETNEKINNQINYLLKIAEDKISHLTPDDEDYYKLDDYKNLAQALKNKNYVTAYKLVGEAGSSLFKNINSSCYNDFNVNTTIENLASVYDENGNRIFTIPYYDYNDSSSTELSGAHLYTRPGYYIQSATYTDQYGHQIVIRANMKDTNISYIDPYGYNTSDPSLLSILNYLTNLGSYLGPSFTIKQTEEDYSSNFEITINGIKTYISKDDPKQIIIPRKARLSFDNTEYDPSKYNSDPKPQTILLHYAPLQFKNDPNYSSRAIQIHYVDVTGTQPLTQEAINELEREYPYITLTPGTKYCYGNGNYSNELYFDPKTGKLLNDGNTPITYTFTEDQQAYDNSTIDAKIVQTLNKLGYVVVQRDKETIGSHRYNIFATDKSTHEYNNNNNDYRYYSSPQNYYVYFKRGQKVNYQAHLENPDGTVSKRLQDSTYLGIGEPGVNQNVGNAHTDLTNDSSPTFSDLYEQIINDLEKKYPNYRVVLSTDVSPILKKSDDINKLGFDPVNEDDPDTPYRDLLLNLYMVQRQSDVAIHYIDVNDSPKTDHYTKDDGTEIESYKQTIENQYVGDTYTNTLRDYAADHYVLAETVDPKATSGTIIRDAQDIYIYLRHERSTIKDPDSKIIKETINYVDENGNTLHDSYQAPDIVLTQTGYYDEHTKQNVITGWAPEDPSFIAHVIPVIDKYEVVSATHNGKSVLSVDNKEVLPIKVSSDSQNVVVTVVYKQINNDTPYTPPTTPPSQPTEPTEPTQPTTPDVKPTTPVTPKPDPEPKTEPKVKPTPTHERKQTHKPVQNKKKNNYKQNSNVHATDMNTHKGKHYSLTTPVHATQETSSIKKASINLQNSDQKQALPQTGERTNKLGLIGLGFGLLAGLIGLIDFKRKKN